MSLPSEIPGHALVAVAALAAVGAGRRVAERLERPALAVPTALALTGLGGWLGAEALSAAGWLNAWGLRAVLAAGALACGAAGRGGGGPGAPSSWRDGPFTRACAGAVLLLLAATFVSALVAPPNNWDAMIYHNARVAQWLDRGSLAFFDTAIDRQNRMPPLASILRLYLLGAAGTDRLFNLVQWSAFAAVVAMAARLVTVLGGSPAAAALAGLLAATQPMAILQATSSQNDLLTAAFTLAAVLVMVDLQAGPTGSSAAALLVFWTCLGLAGLTKGTGYVVGLLVGLAGVLRLWPRLRGDRAAAAALLAGPLLAFALNAPHLARTRAFYGRALPHDEMVAPAVWRSGWPGEPLARAVSQVARNAVNQLDWLVRWPPAARPVLRAVHALHDGLGLSPTDHATTLLGRVESIGVSDPLLEDSAGNTLHVLAAGVAAVALVAARGRIPGGAVLALAVLCWTALAVGIKWMPWNARLHLPALVLTAAPTALVWARWRVGALLAVAVTLAAVPYVVANSLKPWWGTSEAPGLFAASRWQNTVRARPGVGKWVPRMVARLPQGCRRERPVGLLIGFEWEYAFWMAAREQGRALSFRHVTKNAPARPPLCALITDECLGGRPFCFLELDGRPWTEKGS